MSFLSDQDTHTQFYHFRDEAIWLDGVSSNFHG